MATMNSAAQASRPAVLTTTRYDSVGYSPLRHQVWVTNRLRRSREGSGPTSTSTSDRGDAWERKNEGTDTLQGTSSPLRKAPVGAHYCDIRFGHDREGGERVEQVDFGIVWDGGAPTPHLIQSEHRAFLAFYLNDPIRHGMGRG